MMPDGSCREVHALTKGKWHVVDGIGTDEYIYTIAPGTVLYYVSDSEGFLPGGEFLIVDVREGPEEEAE